VASWLPPDLAFCTQLSLWQKRTTLEPTALTTMYNFQPNSHSGWRFDESTKVIDIWGNTGADGGENEDGAHGEGPDVDLSVVGRAYPDYALRNVGGGRGGTGGHGLERGGRGGDGKAPRISFRRGTIQVHQTHRWKSDEPSVSGRFGGPRGGEDATILSGSGSAHRMSEKANLSDQTRFGLIMFSQTISAGGEGGPGGAGGSQDEADEGSRSPDHGLQYNYNFLGEAHGFRQDHDSSGRAPDGRGIDGRHGSGPRGGEGGVGEDVDITGLPAEIKIYGGLGGDGGPSGEQLGNPVAEEDSSTDGNHAAHPEPKREGESEAAADAALEQE
ncbi:hypothetical protein C8R45DRAFT_1161150, partial [Mycena sanguinolenta]